MCVRVKWEMWLELSKRVEHFMFYIVGGERRGVKVKKTPLYIWCFNQNS